MTYMQQLESTDSQRGLCSGQAAFPAASHADQSIAIDTTFCSADLSLNALPVRVPPPQSRAQSASGNRGGSQGLRGSYEGTLGGLHRDGSINVARAGGSGSMSHSGSAKRGGGGGTTLRVRHPLARNYYLMSKY